MAMGGPPAAKRARAGPSIERPPAKAEYVIQAELTWTGEAFERGVRVVVDSAGRIAAVERQAGAGGGVAAEGQSTGEAEAQVVHLRRRALVPGFVNVHSHAFQRGLRGRGELYPREGGEGSFWTWRQAMFALVGSLDVAAFRSLTRRCFEEMAAAGITTVGEFHYLHHSSGAEADFALDAAVVEAAREANVRLVLLNTFYQYAGFGQAPLSELQGRFRTDDLATYWAQMDRLDAALDHARGEGLGVAAHSFRAVDVPTLQALHKEAQRRGIVFHMHIEEQPKEIEDCKAAHGGQTPMAVLLKSVDVNERFTAVHCTHTLGEELAAFVQAGANVCVCPLTEGSLGDGVFAALDQTGGRVCLGTDCNARIDMLEEMRWLEYSQRLRRLSRGAYSAASGDEQLPRHLLRCATEHGARALGVAAGVIEPGLWADFALLDLEAPALAGAEDGAVLGAAVLGASAEGVVADTCVAGRWRKLKVV